MSLQPFGNKAKVHELKIWPEYFAPVKDGRKKFELRKADRDYAVGDVLRLKEYDPKAEKFTGREVEVKVTYILEGQYAIPGFCLMSIEGKPTTPAWLDQALNEGDGVYRP